MRSLRIVGLVVVVAALVLGAAQAGSGLAATSPVVPAGGKVAGKGYAYYLKRLQLIAIATKGRVPTCSTVTVGGQKVAILNAGRGDIVPPLMRTVTCSEPAGRAIYVYVFSNMCSTQGAFRPPANLGTSDAALVKCATSEVEGGGVTPSATLDGHPVNLHPLMTATGVFFVPKSLGGPARAAADGVGLLLRGLSKGTHTFHRTDGFLGPGAPPPFAPLKVHVA